jgi:SAM-dependent methyltransferase
VLRGAGRLAERPIRSVARRLGISTGGGEQWARTVMNRVIDARLAELGPAQLSALEISGSERAHHPWKRYDTLQFPAFDICAGPAPSTYDVVICEQVLEHVEDPWAAMRNLAASAAPGGLVVVSTPFLLRIHRTPEDFWRFTREGLRVLMTGAGLTVIGGGQWGNAACVRGNFRQWVPQRPWRSLKNDPVLPVVVWAFGRAE